MSYFWRKSHNGDSRVVVEKSINQQLLNLVRDSTSKISVISPYIKASTLRSLIEVSSEDNVIEIFMRWDAEDFLSGSSDLECFDLTQMRPKILLYRVDNLHAKLYAGGRNALLGSANLTPSGIGHLQTDGNYDFFEGNLELLHQVEVGSDLREFIQHVEHVAAPISHEDYQEMKDQIKFLEALRPPEQHPTQQLENMMEAIRNWIPLSDQPEKVIQSVLLSTDEDESTNLNAEEIHDLEALQNLRPLLQTRLPELLPLLLSHNKVFRVAFEKLQKESSVRFGAFRHLLPYHIPEEVLQTHGVDPIIRAVYEYLCFLDSSQFSYERLPYSQILIYTPKI